MMLPCKSPFPREKGYSKEWVHQRVLSIRIRNGLTEEWQKRGVEKGVEHAILTDEITRAWSGLTTRQALERETGKPVVAADRAEDFRRLVTDIIEDAAALPEADKCGGGVYH